MSTAQVGSGVGATLSTPRYRTERFFVRAGAPCWHRSLADIPGPMEVDEDAVHALLSIGYVPGDRTLLRGIRCVPGGAVVNPEAGPVGYGVLERPRLRRRPAPVRRGAFIAEAQAAFARAVDRALERATGPAVVPLSGGIDSRIVLSALVQRLGPGAVTTYTYGVPGALDFDIGNAVARAAGTRHVVIDARDQRFNADLMIATARWSDANTSLNHPLIWHEVERHLGTGPTIWTGFAGDGVGGSFYAPWTGTGTVEAVEAYLAAERRPFQRWHAAVGIERPSRLHTLVETETIFDDLLDRREAVWFANHVDRYTGHHVFMNAWDYAVPLMDDELVELFLSCPPSWRAGKEAFNAMARVVAPELMRLPTRDYGYRLTGRLTAPIRQVAWRCREALGRVGHRAGLAAHPHTTYLDFARAYRERGAIRAVARDLSAALRARHIIDSATIDETWRLHDAGMDLGHGISTLISLEAALSAFT